MRDLLDRRRQIVSKTLPRVSLQPASGRGVEACIVSGWEGLVASLWEIL